VAHREHHRPEELQNRLASGKRFHVMHERTHDALRILGGMWGARAKRGAPLPGLGEALAAFVNGSRAGPRGRHAPRSSLERRLSPARVEEEW